MVNNKEAEIAEDMTESDAITRLLAVSTEEVPTIVIPLQRLGIQVTLKALTGKQVSRCREHNTTTVKTRQGPKEKVDTEGFMISLISLSTVKPNWGDPKLIEKFHSSSGDEVIKRLLLGGEINLLGEAVFEVSGYNVELEDVKN